MKAIQTKFLGATDTKPSRIKASAEGVKSLTFTLSELEHDTLSAHNYAAQRFAGSYGWSTNLASGGLPDRSWAHCFLPKEPIVGIPHIPTTDNQKHQAYLDWTNNFVSSPAFAEHYGLSHANAVRLIEEGRVIHEASCGNSIDRLKITRPEIAVVVTWEEDHDYEWDGDGEDPITEGFYPYDVCVTASRIVNGELLEGTAYLGGCYSKDAGKDNPEVSGYLDGLVEEAVANLDKQK